MYADKNLRNHDNDMVNDIVKDDYSSDGGKIKE
jgi:hypothetical protein